MCDILPVTAESRDSVSIYACHLTPVARTFIHSQRVRESQVTHSYLISCSLLWCLARSLSQCTWGEGWEHCTVHTHSPFPPRQLKCCCWSVQPATAENHFAFNSHHICYSVLMDWVGTSTCGFLLCQPFPAGLRCFFGPYCLSSYPRLVFPIFFFLNATLHGLLCCYNVSSF